MPDAGILILFFTVVVGGVFAAGYKMLDRADGTAAVEATPAEPLREALKSFGSIVPKRSSHVDQYRRMLYVAGFRQADALTTYFGIKAASILGIGCILAMISLIITGESEGVVLAFLAGSGLGHLLPDRVLRRIHQRREQAIRRSLPITLEMMILGLEAGQSIDAAIGETARELDGSHPEIAEELNLVLMDMLASRGRQEALRQLIDRNTEPEIKRVAQVLIDGDRFGTGLSTALRSQLRYLRIRMRQSAQEQARKIGVKLVFPVFFLIFPAILLVTLGPAVIRVFEALTRMLAL
ncbi:MAG: type II secretion system F family protein [Acidobacteria bacterium]|nr:type II secretion system F family protein [Acidobacteriota bacterium]